MFLRHDEQVAYATDFTHAGPKHRLLPRTPPSHLMKNLFLASSFHYDKTGRGGESIE
jgi:hypothetical protein